MVGLRRAERKREGELGQGRERGPRKRGGFCCFCFYLKLFEFAIRFSFEFELDTRVRFKTGFQNIYLIC
jgi:hypothetical protein